jgi:hypothetical protein
LIDFSVLDRSLELKTLGDHFSILLLLLVVEVKVTFAVENLGDDFSMLERRGKRS